MTPPVLSIVIPALNEAARLPRTLQRIAEDLEASHESHEILVVDDGSTDGTADAAVRTLGPAVTVLRNDRNRGKGYSVRRGMLAAAGARRLMTDADLSTPIEERHALGVRLDAGDDIAIGSRALPGSRIEVHQPLLREGMGRAFNVFVRLLAVPGVRDSQCGFKLFTAAAAQAVFSRCRLDGFSFDVEALHVARRLGLRVAEVPVVWRNDAASRVTLVRGAAAFADLLRIRLNASRGRYGRGSGL
ncbi:MAG: glycosyltransferase family 2 protein [Vicinamibacterales bacterium]|nr:glycosyltransferase family 2 protein [Vicinamibacterales bacterium]